MSKITASDIQHLAVLSKLSLTDDEVEKYRQDIDSIVGFIDQLQSVDVDDYEPTDQVSGLKNVVRPDELQDFGLTIDELKRNAKVQDGQFVVKRVMK